LQQGAVADVQGVSDRRQLGLGPVAVVDGITKTVRALSQYARVEW